MAKRSLKVAKVLESEGLMNLTLHQRVVLKRDIAEHQLCAGDVAYLVDFVPHPAGGEQGCVVEVFNALGESLAVAVVPVSDVEPLAADEVLSVRRMPGSARSA